MLAAIPITHVRWWSYHGPVDGGGFKQGVFPIWTCPFLGLSRFLRGFPDWSFASRAKPFNSITRTYQEQSRKGLPRNSGPFPKTSGKPGGLESPRLTFFQACPCHQNDSELPRSGPIPKNQIQLILGVRTEELSAPKSQRFLRFAIAMPIADPRNRAISDTRDNNAALRFKSAMESR